MKYFDIKLFLHFVIVISLFLFSCSSENEQSKENNTDSVEISSSEKETAELSVKEVLSQLGNAEFSANGKLSYDAKKSSGWDDIEVFNSMEMISEKYDFSHALLWKYLTDDRIIVCIEAERMTAMSESDIDFWLVIFDKEYNKTDELLFAKIHRDESSNGYEDPSVEFADGKFITDEGSFSINENGKFVKSIGEIKEAELKEFSNLFKKTDLVFSIDADLLENKDRKEFNELNAGQVKTLFKGDDDFAGMYVNTGSFIMIDSLKEIGAYDEFVNGDNAGEVEEAEAYAFYTINLGDSYSAYIWGIWDATQETGGPHSSGITYYISFVKNFDVKESFPFAEFSSGGDAPMWQERKITATFDKNKILTIHYKEVLGDDDSGSEDVTEKEYRYVFQEGKLVFNNLKVIQGEE